MPDQQPDALRRLRDGILRFEREVYPARQAEYEAAASNPQRPHTLLITCADSRIDPGTLTQSAPGDLFVTRNIGNMVPPYGEMLGGVSAVIEYAVDALKVRHAVICGHTDCGAMKGLLAGEDALTTMPAVKMWLRNAEAAKRAAASVDEGTPTLPTITEQNVLLQMQHLRTHPSIADAAARGELSISGWIYDIARGDVHVFDETSQRFISIREQAARESNPVS